MVIMAENTDHLWKADGSSMGIPNCYAMDNFTPSSRTCSPNIATRPGLGLKGSSCIYSYQDTSGHKN